MFRRRLVGLALALVAVVLVACAGYTEQGPSESEHRGMGSGDLTVEIGKANGTTTKSIELAGGGHLTLEADVTLAVGLGSYKIELLGANDQVTLVLEANAGETVEGHGQMVTDTIGEASYRVTATNAEKVTYVIEYTFK